MLRGTKRAINIHYSKTILSGHHETLKQINKNLATDFLTHLTSIPYLRKQDSPLPPCLKSNTLSVNKAAS